MEVANGGFSVSTGSNDARWWSGAPERRHEDVLRVVKQIRSNQEYRKVADLLHASMYGDLPMLGFGVSNYAMRPTTASSRLSLNVCRNMVGAVTSKIASKNKPKPTFLTEGGDYDLRERAEKLEKFVGGVFYESGVYQELARCFRDACIYGTGALKIYDDGDRVAVERVIPWEIVVDDGEALYGSPRSLYQRRYFDRLVLRSLWAEDDEELAALIDRAPRDPDDQEYAYQTTADQLLVTEAWHLGERAGVKGRHVVCIEGATLLDEEWDGPFPFAFLRWSEPIAGFFGVGLVEELRGVQLEINKLLQQIQRAHHFITGHYLVEGQSKVSAAQLNNDLTALVRFTGVAPKYEAPQIISPEVYQHLWQLYAKAFEIAGISQLNANGTKPAGLNSGEAQRVYQDIQTERFLEVGQAFEEFVIEAARQVIRAARRVGSGYRVRHIEKGSIERIEWKDVNLDEDLYVIKVFPTSLLPSTPAGKLEWAEDRIKSGLIPAEDMLDVLEFPDTEQYARRKLAPRRVIERNISHIIRKGEFVSPEPADDHKLAMRLVNEAYHNARLDKVPEARLELLRRYMADTSDFLGPPPAPPGAMPAPPMAAPPGPMPGAPPPMTVGGPTVAPLPPVNPAAMAA